MIKLSDLLLIVCVATLIFIIWYLISIRIVPAVDQGASVFYLAMRHG